MQRIKIFFIIIQIIILLFCYCSRNQNDEVIALRQEILKKETQIQSLKQKMEDKNTIIDSLQTITQLIQNSPDQMNLLSKSKLLSDQYNYIVVALSDWSKNNKNQVWATPIFQVADSMLVNPYNQKGNTAIRDYFNDPDRFFSIHFGGANAGILKVGPKCHISEPNFEMIYIDPVLSKRTRETNLNYRAIASTLFLDPNSKMRKRFANGQDKTSAKSIAKRELKYQGINVTLHELELIDLQLIQPANKNTEYAFCTFRFYQHITTNKEIHYLSLFYSTNTTNPKPYFKKHTHAPAGEMMGPMAYFLLDVLDYNFDGKDEILIIESGFEHSDIIMFELIDEKLIEIYRIETSLT